MLCLSGGKEVQMECKLQMQTKGRLLVSEVFKSCPGNLKCRAVLHAVGPQWVDGSQKQSDYLAETVSSVLTKANELRVGSSVIFLSEPFAVFFYVEGDTSSSLCLGKYLKYSFL
jgi:O-acetyl-ADP-ribose deacetylase (regulator of RNase III)